jgi:2-polyprenyl-6-hydroxyphenyl methylase/3-demethylubiquinone-9 3-methyltransferase
MAPSRDGAVNAAVGADPDRFAFGRNWARYLRLLNDERIALAEASLVRLTGVADLSGKSLLDVGSGSGLFSLAARHLGATIVSFDFDRDSVSCTEHLRERFGQAPEQWQIHHGSVLDGAFMRSLGKFDIVYSWGVLHHTGDMWTAVDNAAAAVAEGGLFCLALYNDQGSTSRRWRAVKRLYNRTPAQARTPFVLALMLPFEAKWLALHMLKGDIGGYVRGWSDYATTSERGMSRWHDWVDWVGGFPFEVAKPEDVLERLRAHGFVLERLVTRGGGRACNEYTFRKAAAPRDERN